MSEELACCAHLAVRWRTQLSPQGTTTGWWECTDCHLPFAPTAVADGYATRIDNQRKEIERLNRFADFLCRQDWTSRGRAIAEEAFMNAIAMDKEAGFPQPESRDG